MADLGGAPAPDGFDIGPDNPAVHKSIWHDVVFTSQDGLRLYARLTRGNDQRVGDGAA